MAGECKTSFVGNTSGFSGLFYFILLRIPIAGEWLKTFRFCLFANEFDGVEEGEFTRIDEGIKAVATYACFHSVFLVCEEGSTFG